MLDSKDLLHNFMRGILAYPYTEALVKGEEKGNGKEREEVRGEKEVHAREGRMGKERRKGERREGRGKRERR